MIRITLADCQNDPMMQNAVDYCTTDPRWLAMLNESQRRLVQRGHWVGSSAIIAACVTNGNLSWPRRVASIEGVNIARIPIDIRNKWFEFLPLGPGYQDNDSTTTPPTWPNGVNQSAGLQMLERQPTTTFADIVDQNGAPIPFQLNISADNAADCAKNITIQCYDQYGNKVYNLDGSEGVTAPVCSSVGTLVQMPFYNVIKDVTLGYVRLTAFLPSTGQFIPIAVYEPGETNPIYRRSLIPQLSTFMDPRGCNGSTASKNITGLCKMEVVKLVNPTDVLLLGNMPALRLGMMAIKKEYDNLLQESAGYWGAAMAELNNELIHYQGAGEKIMLRMETPGTFADWGVQNPM